LSVRDTYRHSITRVNMDIVPQNEWASAVTPTQAVTVWRKACVTCAQAKRQCTKQVPRCRRCLEKGLLCAYPPPRRPEAQITAAAQTQNDRTSSLLQPGTAAAVVPLVNEDEGPAEMAAPLLDFIPDPIDIDVDMPRGDDHIPTFAFPEMTELELQSLRLLNGYINNSISPELSLPQAPPTTTSSSSSSSSSDAPVVSLIRDDAAWFLRPETWMTEFTEPPVMTTREIESSLKHFIEQVKVWMRQWVTDGHSPIHHRELYTFDMPRHTQDAYTAITMYYNYTTSSTKTRDSEATVHRILEDRVTQLLQEQAVDELSSRGDTSEASIFKRLSRVQALLCYQVIRLFDGDIRMRAQAEALIPVLFAWNKQMLETVKESLGHPERFLVSSPYDPNSLFATPNTTTTTTTADSSSSPKATWRAWILAESVRRTWQVTGIVQESYQFLKRGWSECPGHLPSTMRKTLWDARSASAWAAKLQDGGDPLLLPMGRLDDVIFARTPPAEVDDFNVSALTLYGMERVDRWLEEKEKAKANDRRHVLPDWGDLFLTDSTN